MRLDEVNKLKLIDKESLCKNLLNAWDTADKECNKLVSEIIGKIIVPIVINEPKVDAEPVRHAQWIELEDYPFATVYSCSKCGREISLDYGEFLKDYPYCNCGCKMDEVNEDE